jgi:hypothetical protein
MSSSSPHPHPLSLRERGERFIGIYHLYGIGIVGFRLSRIKNGLSGSQTGRRIEGFEMN